MTGFGDPTSDTLTYTIDDGAGGTDTATVTIIVTPVNDAPVGGRNAFFSGFFDETDHSGGAGGADTAPPTVTPVNDEPVTGRNALLHGLLRRDCVIIAGTAAQINAVLAGLPYTSNLNFNGGDTRIDF